MSEEDLVQLRESIDRWVERDYQLPRHRSAKAAAVGHDEAAWQEFAELGWLGLPIAEAHGGAGLDDAALLCLMTGVGRGLLVEPVLSTCVLGAGLVAACGTAAQQAAILPEIVAGRTKLALAYMEPRLGYARGPVTTAARPNGDGWSLSGEKCAVLDAPAADRLLVTAHDPQGKLGVFVVAPSAGRLEQKSWRTVDGRVAADLVLTGAPATRLGDGDAADALDLVLDRATLAVSAEAVGVMDFLLNDTNAYLKTRKQFGQPLSRFQVLQHRLVDMFVALEECRGMVDAALAAIGGDPIERRATCSALKAQICQAGRLIGGDAVQLHGGMGMTDELKIGHGFKRLMQIETLFGNADFHLVRYAEASGALAAPN
ncbi:MAG: acyl-CoA dehydrogenase family protein [Proteobacteria bacterium]|nr:acyl-CoA dehydrogenase family protein [Pseudomonadota bacterium]